KEPFPTGLTPAAMATLRVDVSVKVKSAGSVRRMHMRIGEVARRAGVSTRALRYYEERGLLSSERTYSGQRVYPQSAVERVRLIQQLLTAGLPSRTIAQLMPSIESGEADPDVFELMAAERARITAELDALVAARD